MLTRVFNLATYISFILWTKKKKEHKSAFPSFNFFMFTEEDGPTINMEDGKEF